MHNSYTKLDQYLISNSQSYAHITPLLYHQSNPFVWPMVISSQSYISCTAPVLSNITTPALPAETLVSLTVVGVTSL